MSIYDGINATDPGDIIDRIDLLARLQQYYGTEELEKIRLSLKQDLKNAIKIRKLLLYTGFAIEDFIVHSQFIFTNLFNSVLIRKLKAEIKKLD
jgi:hypothetical protein